MFIYIIYAIQPLIKSLIIQFLRKDFINYTIQQGTTQAFILQIILLQKTQLKALEILRLSSKTTRFRLFLYTIYTYQVSSSSAIYIKRPSLTPIQLASSIPVSSAILDRQLATILLSSFLIVLSSTISQQAFTVVQDGFYGFYRTTVIESLNSFR